MQCGFAMLCAGSVRQKNVKNILLKNLLDACGGAIGFWSVGYALALGGGGKFVGDENKYFFLRGLSSGADYIGWFFQFAFAATAATIVAGTVAERCKMEAYLCYSFFLTAFVYPVVVHAIWNGDGYLSAFASEPYRGVGVIDFAGSGVVHMTGGAVALIGAIILGPRIGRFYDADGNKLSEPQSFPPSNAALQMLGTFILWFGWYGFNPGSTLFISPAGYGDVAALAAVTTTLAPASGAVSAVLLDTLIGFVKAGEVEFDLGCAMNGALAGLVAITAGCSTVVPWAAVVIGIVAGWVYVLSSKLLAALKIDDAVDAVPVHFFNGMWGLIAVGLFADMDKMNIVGYNGNKQGVIMAALAGDDVDSDLLICQLYCLLGILGWTVATMAPFFFALKRLHLFRVSILEEEVGLDILHHKGSAYDLRKPPRDKIEQFIARKGAKLKNSDATEKDDQALSKNC